LTSETHHLFREEQLRNMKPTERKDALIASCSIRWLCSPDREKFPGRMKIVLPLVGSHLLAEFVIVVAQATPFLQEWA
jgi:hypothetical protein